MQTTDPPTMQCVVCHRRRRIPASVARKLASGEVEVAGYLCFRCAETPEGQAVLASWPQRESEDDE